jgi:L-fuculose-phosphate aldolase
MSYAEKYEHQMKEFLQVCRRLSENMYVTSHGGNLAWRLEEDLILITPTKLNKGDIRVEDLVFIDLEGKRVEGERKPTGETPMYLNFFGQRPDISSVIHCHPPYTNAFAITEDNNWLMRPTFPETSTEVGPVPVVLMRPTFPETSTEVGPVPVVPYGEPLTQKLADNFLPYLRKYNAFLMENHGLVIMSPEGIYRTLELIEILEVTSQSLVAALAIGEIREISRKDVQDLDNTMRTRNLPLFGAPGVNRSLVDLYFT